MLRLDRGGFTKEQVLNALLGVNAPVQLRFRYDLLDNQNRRIRELDNVIDGEISVNNNANIKRTAKFTLRDDENINFLSDRIQPFAEVLVKGKKQWTAEEEVYFLSHDFPSIQKELRVTQEGAWVRFPLGVFLLSAPKRADQDNTIIRDIDAFDGLIVLKQDRFSTRHNIPQGTNYVTAVTDILQGAGITRWNIESTDKVLEKDLEFEPGREKLFAINEILRQINYDGLRVDVNGVHVSSLYRSPTQRSAEFTYIDDDKSVTVPGMEEEFDLTEVPNEFVIVRSNEEQPPIKSVFVNDNPDSPTSTINRGRTITDYREIENMSGQEALDSYTLRIAREASQVYGRITFESGLMPFHDLDDIINITYSRLGINAKYSEQSWTMPLQAGATMKHELRRVISV